MDTSNLPSNSNKNNVTPGNKIQRINVAADQRRSGSTSQRINVAAGSYAIGGVVGNVAVAHAVDTVTEKG